MVQNIKQQILQDLLLSCRLHDRLEQDPGPHAHAHGGQLDQPLEGLRPHLEAEGPVHEELVGAVVLAVDGGELQVSEPAEDCLLYTSDAADE